MYSAIAIATIVVAWVTAVRRLVVCHDCHCHCRNSFRLQLLLLWCSGCTWREGHHGDKDDDRGRVHAVDAAKGLLSETNKQTNKQTRVR